MTSKQQFLPEKLSKFNSTLHSDLLIECQFKHIIRKISRTIFACHHSLMAPSKIKIGAPPPFWTEQMFYIHYFAHILWLKTQSFPPPPKKNNSWLASLAKFNISCFLNFTVLKWCFHRSTWVILKIMRVVAYLVNHDTYRIETLHVFGTGLFTHSIQK